MPRSGQPKQEEAQRLRDRIALGVLTATFGPELVDEAIERCGRREQRYRLLPARLVVYYVLAMTLFREAGYEEVLRELTEGLAWASGEAEGLELPSSVAISKARARLGVEPLAALFAAGCVPLATPTTKGAFFRRWRLVSIDGSVLDTPDTPDNVDAFGRPGSGRGESAFPQLRVVALAEWAQCSGRCHLPQGRGAAHTGKRSMTLS
ncbi:MAG: transposase domain-containing protein [Acidimicrobiales bacterium]